MDDAKTAETPKDHEHRDTVPSTWEREAALVDALICQAQEMGQ